MQTPEETNLKTHDSLNIIFLGFDESPEMQNKIKSLLLCETKVSSSTQYIPITNKYFSSNVEVIIHNKIDTLVESYENAGKKLNVVAVVHTSGDMFSKLGNNTLLNEIFLSSQENTEAFKCIWRVTGAEAFDKPKFYETFDCFILISELDPNNNFKNEDNKQVIKDFMEDVNNFTWKHEPNVPKPKNKNNGDKTLKENNQSNQRKDALFKDKKAQGEAMDMEFMNMFDEILSFNKVKMQLSPKSRKEQASDLILGLVQSLENAQKEDHL
jgi:hypothetical protein